MKKLIAILILSIVPASVSSEEVTPTENTHGCLVAYCTYSGSAIFNFFVKVADDEWDSEDGEPQIWGYRADDVNRDKNGKLLLQAVPAKKFVKGGMVYHQGGCICHCPNW